MQADVCKRRDISAGKGMALAGLIMGYLSVLSLVAMMAFPAIQMARQDSPGSAMLQGVVMSNLKQISLSTYIYAEKNKEFPDTIWEVLEHSQLELGGLENIITNPNFRYIKPSSSPESTEFNTPILEFRIKNGVYRAYFDCHVEFIEQP